MELLLGSADVELWEEGESQSILKSDLYSFGEMEEIDLFLRVFYILLSLFTLHFLIKTL